MTVDLMFFMLEKPREKMQKTGPECLKDHELMSIILGRGTRKENVFELSQRLFKNFDREELINEKKVDTLKRSLNTGFVQTCQIMACIELGKRLLELTRDKSRFNLSKMHIK
jgi:DNA repair protein RadC